MIAKFEDIFDSIYHGDPGNLEMALLRMKESGATQMQSALVLIKKLKLSIGDADILIVHSDAWKENKNNIIQVRNQFGDVKENRNKSIKLDKLINSSIK